MHERLRAYLVSAILLVAVTAPAFRDPEVDSYPLSTYPMFSRRRGRTNTVTSALAIAPRRETIPPQYVANAESMQAFRTLSQAAARGGEAAEALCHTIAARLAEARDPAFAGAERVELVSESVDAIDYLAGRAEPTDCRVHARCAVEAP